MYRYIHIYICIDTYIIHYDSILTEVVVRKRITTPLGLQVQLLEELLSLPMAQKEGQWPKVLVIFKINGQLTLRTILVGGWATHLKNMKVNWDDEIPNIWENKTWQPNHQPD